MSKTISRSEIQARLQRRELTVLVEALPARYYRKAHLPGALNLPHTEVAQRAREVLPDRDAFIVVYCASTTCSNSGIAARELEALGYTQVFEYVEGKQDWIDAGLAVEPARGQEAA